MKERISCSVVVPVYNEELVIAETYSKIKEVLDSSGDGYEIIFVNDGSCDKTREKIETICQNDANAELLNLSRNFGHQAAITAGMEASEGDSVVVIDGDLQDPPDVILRMIGKWREGYDVVYGKRIKREGETWFKKVTAAAYYRILKKITTTEIPVDTGDFRLIDRKVCDALSALPEKSRYIRGLVSWLGFRQTYVEYSRNGRFAGETKYSLSKMLKLAADGITSFSSKPLILPGYFGGFILVLGDIVFLVSLSKSLISGTAVLNLALVLSINLMLFGLAFCSLGIMGLYIGRILEESKDRPLYIVESKIKGKRADEYAAGS